VSLRRVELAPLSPGEELVAVARTAMAISVGTWLYLMTNPFMLTNDGSARRDLLPYQRLILDRPADEQRMFRELQVALIEAETLRSMTGSWPDTEALAADAIEPFAPNAALKGPPYQWRLSRDGLFVNYVGIAPESPGAAGAPAEGPRPPAWLILIQEPDPAAPEPFQDDEDHDRLLDGSVLHVSIWNRPEGGTFPARVIRAPQAEGWVQLYAAPPPSTHATTVSLPAP
jgi:hypothetical protein